MPHQEIYLALLDQQASAAMGELERLLGDPPRAEAAGKRAVEIGKTIEKEYTDPEKGCYAFSHNADGSRDRTRTVYPALAWWSGSSSLVRSNECLRQFAGHTLNTDWGLRDLANDEKIYDGMSYHQGSVWPLFTGWAALAEYRGGQPLAGYQMLMENANLTRFQDLGSHTELLSGDFYVPFGRSTSHQLWSSAMVITPTLRGLFGISIDAQTKTVTVNPHLPAGWENAYLTDLPLASGTADIGFERKDGMLEVRLKSRGDEGWKLRSDLAGARFGGLKQAEWEKKAKIPADEGLGIPLTALEVDEYAKPYAKTAIDAVTWPMKEKRPGARTSRIRVLHEEQADKALTLTLEGEAGSAGILTLLRNVRIQPHVELVGDKRRGNEELEASVSYRDCDADPYECKTLPLIVNFPPGDGWKTITVTLAW